MTGRARDVFKMTVKIKTLLVCILMAGAVLCRGPAAADNGSAGPAADIVQASLSGKPVSRVDIDLSGPETNTAYWIDLAGTLIKLTEGDLFSPALLQQSLDYLKDCGRFAEVRAEVARDGEAVALRFHLTVNRVIRDIVIDIKGRSGVFKSDIRNVMSVYPGKIFSDREMEAQKGIIADLFKARGFPSPTVEVAAHEDTDDYTVVLRVTIGLGPWHAVKSIHVSGNRAFSDARLKSRMKTWRASFFHVGSARFNPRVLDRDVDALTEFYRKKGFAEAAVTVTLKKNGKDNGFSITVQVDEGPHYEIEFSGNDAFSDRTLRKDLTLFSGGNRGGLGIRKSVKNMNARYYNAGFLKAVVDVEEQSLSTADRARKQIRFVVNEGRRTVVRSIKIRGNSDIPDEKIDRQMLTQPRTWKKTGVYVPQVLEEDIRALQRLYRKRGFPHARIEKTVSLNEDGTEADIVIMIDEEERIRVSSVRFEGLQAISEAQALKALRLTPGKRFDEETAQRDRIELAALVSEKGRPHVRVESSIIMNDDGRMADIVYQVEEGPPVVMGSVFVSGNLRTRESVVRQEIEMAEDDPFSLTRMIRSQQNLRSLDIFRSVNVTPVGLGEKDEQVHLFIETFERAPFFVELGGGYNSEQGGFGKVSAGDHNLLGGNRDAYASWELSETGYRGDLGVRSPRFFLPRLSSVLNLSMEKTEAFNQDFGVKTRGASFGIDREWSREFSTGINVNAEKRKKYPLSATGDADEAYETRNAVAVTPGLIYDTRDNGLMPASGMLASCNVTFSRGINSNLDDFIKYQGTVRYYRSFLKTLTIAVIGRAGYIDPDSASTPVSDDQLFFLGGISSVRGFKENMLVSDEQGDPVGGRLSLSGTIEARVPVREVLSLILFYDVGRLDHTYTPADPGTRSSVGIGLGYQTPVGPISLYYGSKLDRQAHEDAGRFHFSIGYTF